MHLGVRACVRACCTHVQTGWSPGSGMCTVGTIEEAQTVSRPVPDTAGSMATPAPLALVIGLRPASTPACVHSRWSCRRRSDLPAPCTASSRASKGTATLSPGALLACRTRTGALRLRSCSARLRTHWAPETHTCTVFVCCHFVAGSQKQGSSCPQNPPHAPPTLATVAGCLKVPSPSPSCVPPALQTARRSHRRLAAQRRRWRSRRAPSPPRRNDATPAADRPLTAVSHNDGLCTLPFRRVT